MNAMMNTESWGYIFDRECSEDYCRVCGVVADHWCDVHTPLEVLRSYLTPTVVTVGR